MQQSLPIHSLIKLGEGWPVDTDPAPQALLNREPGLYLSWKGGKSPGTMRVGCEGWWNLKVKAQYSKEE